MIPLEMMTPGGIGFSPDGGMAVVTDAGGRFAWSYQVGPGGDLQNGEPFYRLEMPEAGWISGVRSAVVDSIGQVYFVSAIGVQVCEANGRVAAILHSPSGTVSALAFGRSDLFVATEGGLYRRPVKVTGGMAFGANENLTTPARIELTPLETVLATTDAAEGPSSSAPLGARVPPRCWRGNIIHAEGVPRYRLSLLAQAR